MEEAFPACRLWNVNAKTSVSIKAAGSGGITEPRIGAVASLQRRSNAAPSTNSRTFRGRTRPPDRIRLVPVEPVLAHQCSSSGVNALSWRA